MGDKQEEETPGPRDNSAQPAPTDAFDIWLERSLHDLYDGVTAEPIPPELLRLIDEARTQRTREPPATTEDAPPPTS